MGKKISIVLPLFLLLIAFLIYWMTKPPSILWIDSGTMIAASATLGIPNPPGFPFYMLASHLATQFPFLNMLTKLELFTILFSLGLLFLVYKIILLLISSLEPPNQKSGKLSFHIPFLSALFGALSLAFSYEYWSQTQNTEAFIFTYFFVALFAYLLLKAHFNKDLGQRKTSYIFKIFLLISFLYGIASGANPTVASLIPGVLLIIYLNRKYFNFVKLLILAFIFLATTVLIYSYLPIRAMAYPFVNWGNPQTLNLIIGHLRGAGLNIYEPDAGSINGFTGSPLIFVQSVSYFFVLIFFQFTPILLPFMILGLYYLFKKNKYLFFFLLSVPITNIIYAGIYYSGNQESWFILSWIFLSIFIGLGFYRAASHFVNSKFKLLFLFALCFVPLVTFFLILNRGNHYYSSDYTYNLYNNLDKNAILLGTGDFFNSASNYVHEGDKFRPDVTPITVNMFYVNRWYRDNLRHATNLSISSKIDDIIQYKNFSEYNDAMNELIAENIQTHPVYVTHLALRASALVATSGGQLRLDNRFKFVPNGLTLKVVKANDSSTPNLASFDYKFKSPLENKPIYLERNYKAAFSNILNDYIYGYEFLGDWYADHKQEDLALSYYKKGAQLSDNNIELLGHLGEFYARKKEFDISRQYFQKAIVFDPRNVSLHFNLGLSFANMNKIQEAKQEFEAVIALSPVDDPIAMEANNVIAQIEPQNKVTNSFTPPSSWKNIKDVKNNFSLFAPTDFKKNTNPNGTTVIYYEGLGNSGITIEIVGSSLKESENIDEFIKSSPIKMTGILLDTQTINVQGFVGAVQVYGTTQGDSSQLFILRQNQSVWLFKVYPGNSIKISVFNQILNTLRPYKI